MKAEKIQKEQMQRTIQPMRKGGGTAQFVDNRNAVQLISSEDEEESLQLKKDSALQRKPNNTGLPDNLKTGVENLSGLSMDDVRVHYNSSKPATVQALAYTQGADIHVAPGQEQHLPHETWHVVQQMQGRVQPTTEVGGMPVNNDVGLEREADVMGGEILQKKVISRNITIRPIGSKLTQTIQRLEIIKEKDSEKILSRRNDVLSSIAYLNLKPEGLLKGIGIYVVCNDNEAKKRFILNKKPGHNINNIDSDFNDVVNTYDGGMPQNITENDEAFVHLMIDIAGGACYCHPEKAIFIQQDKYSSRTLLHELGHVKQYDTLGIKDLPDNILRANDEMIQLFDYHNIILHENFFNGKNDLIYEKQEWFTDDTIGGSKKRVLYNKSNLKSYENIDLNKIKVRSVKQREKSSPQEILSVHHQMACDILEKLKDRSIYSVSVCNTILNHLLRDCKMFFIDES